MVGDGRAGAGANPLHWFERGRSPYDDHCYCRWCEIYVEKGGPDVLPNLFHKCCGRRLRFHPAKDREHIRAYRARQRGKASWR